MNHIFGDSQPPIIMDDPARGGITGNMPRSPIGMPQSQPMMQQQPQSNPMPQQNTVGLDPESMRLKAIYDQIYTPQNEMQNMLRDQVTHMPVRQNPGIMAKIAASMQGFGGRPQQQIEHTLYGKYDRQMQDWKAKNEPVEKAAAEERLGNVNERIAARDMASQQLGREKQTSKDKLDNEKLVISKQRADAYEFSKMHPTWKGAVDADGHLWYVNPENPTMKIDTGVKQLSEMDKIQYRVDGELKEIAARGSEARRTEVVKEGNRQNDISARGDQNRQTNSEKPKGTGNTAKPQSESDKKVGDYRRARQALIEHPEWSKFIKLDTNGANTFVVTPSNDDVVNRTIKIYLSGSNKDTNLSPNAKPAAKLQSTTLTDPKTGHVYETATWSDKDIQEAMNRGWK